MASKRLTTGMRTNILESILSNTILKKIEGLRKKRNEIGDKIYEICIADYMEDMKKMPEGFFSPASRFSLNLLTEDAQVVKPKLLTLHTAQAESTGNAKMKEGYTIVVNMSEYELAPALLSQMYPMFVISKDTPLITEYLDACRAVSAMQEDVYKVRRQIAEALKEFKTVKSLKELWPDIVEYIPKEILDETDKNLPSTLKVEKINQKIKELTT